MNPAELPVASPPREEPTPPPKNSRGLWSTLASAGLFLLLKMKSALVLLKALPFAKVALTSLSALAMIAFEAQRSGWAFGVGFVALIFVHEMGHGYAIRKAGLVAGWPVFIPFFGAMIALKGRTPDADTEARIAFGGPLAGALSSLLCAGLAIALGSRWMLGVAHVGFFLNLFNMIPISPLDGGRIAQAFSKRGWMVGGGLLVAMFFVTGSPQLVLIGGLSLLQAFRGPRGDHPPLSPVQQRSWARRYFGLCFLLGAAVYGTQHLLSAGLAEDNISIDDEGS